MITLPSPQTTLAASAAAAPVGVVRVSVGSMPDVTIYHNPNCSTSKFAVTEAERLGLSADIVLYMKTKPDVGELTSLLAKLEDPPADLVRKDAFFAEKGVDPDDYVTSETVAALLAVHPRLLQRPVVVKGDRAIIGRPKNRVTSLLS